MVFEHITVQVQRDSAFDGQGAADINVRRQFDGGDSRISNGRSQVIRGADLFFRGVGQSVLALADQRRRDGVLRRRLLRLFRRFRFRLLLRLFRGFLRLLPGPLVLLCFLLGGLLHRSRRDALLCGEGRRGQKRQRHTQCQ